MIQNHIYEAPEAEILEVRFEECILSTTKSFQTQENDIFSTYNPNTPS